MAHRILVGLLVAATLSGCFDGGNSLSGSSSSGGERGNNLRRWHRRHGGADHHAGGAREQRNRRQQLLLSADRVPASSGVVNFAIEGQPAWASFDASTGVLSGTPSTNDVGIDGGHHHHRQQWPQYRVGGPLHHSRQCRRARQPQCCARHQRHSRRQRERRAELHAFSPRRAMRPASR